VSPLSYSSVLENPKITNIHQLIFQPWVCGYTQMTGRKPEISDKEILQVFAESTDSVLSAPEIAEQFDYSTPGIYKRLRALQDESRLNSKKIGQGRAWWLTDEGKQYLDEVDR
jgi:hypothetical protein